MARRANNRTCSICRYWSELIAESTSSGVKAMCLSPASKHRQKYTLGEFSCLCWASGYAGAVDDPEIGDLAIVTYERDAREK
jgi:hypothetical protein